MLDKTQPTPAQIAQRLRQMDERLERRYPGYLKTLEQLREPRTYAQEGEWNPVSEMWHTWKRREEQ